MTRPLSGVTVGVTRPVHQAEALAEVLRDLGAHVVCVPLLEVEMDTGGMAALRRSLCEGNDMPDVVVVTSPNGARCLAEVWPYGCGDHGGPAPQVVVVGPGTADALHAAGGPSVTTMAVDHVAEGVMDVMGDGCGKVVVAQGDLARPVLVEGLRQRGWKVTSLTVYRTVARRPSAAEGLLLLGSDLVTLASASAARSWSSWLAGRQGPAVVVMGPVTELEARRSHLDIAAVAQPHSLEGLVEAAIQVAQARRQGGITPSS